MRYFLNAGLNVCTDNMSRQAGAFQLLCCVYGRDSTANAQAIKKPRELTLSASYKFTQLVSETALCSSLIKCLVGTL